MAAPLLPNKLVLEGTPTPATLDDDSEKLSARSQYADSIENGDFSDYGDYTARPSIAGKLLLAIGMSSRRRKGGNDYEPTFREEIPAGLLKRHPPREIRRCRRTYVLGLVKRVLIATPFVILMLFGVLHILHALIGRARLFWDMDVSDDYLPGWGMPGHLGEGLASYPTDATRDVIPIACHSHNDYWRHVPLFDAIHWGCTGVEADVWLFDKEVYVGHNLAALTRNRTFKDLYVNPLVDLLDKMNPNTDFVNSSGHGVFDVAPHQTLVLLVDFKTNGHELFSVVSQQLEALRAKGYLSFWDGEKVNSRAITVVGTGNTPFDLVVNATGYRDIFYDAPLDKLWEAPRSPIQRDDPLHDEHDELDYGEAMSLPEGNDTSSGQGRVGTGRVQSPNAFNTTSSYYASTSFTSAVGFVWRGHLSPRQMDIIRGQIRGAKRRGLKARYWDTPSWPIALRNHVWHVLMREGADVLNVDDLRAAAVDQWKARVHQWW